MSVESYSKSDYDGRWTGIDVEGRHIELHEEGKGSGIYHCRVKMPVALLNAVLDSGRLGRCVCSVFRSNGSDKPFVSFTRADLLKGIGMAKLGDELWRYDFDVVCAYEPSVGSGKDSWEFWLEGVHRVRESVDDLGYYYSREEEQRNELVWDVGLGEGEAASRVLRRRRLHADAQARYDERAHDC